MLETGDFGGDKLSGLEFAGKRISERSTANTWSRFSAENERIWRAAQKTQDTKNVLFGVRRFQRFLHQKRSGDKDR